MNKMIKNIVIVLALTFLLVGCTASYTCPTYADNQDVNIISKNK